MKRIEINSELLKTLLGLGWSRTKIAAKLGVSRRTLYRYMKENKLTGEIEPQELNEIFDNKNNESKKESSKNIENYSSNKSKSNNANQDVDWSLFDDFEKNIKYKME